MSRFRVVEEKDRTGTAVWRVWDSLKKQFTGRANSEKDAIHSADLLNEMDERYGHSLTRALDQVEKSPDKPALIGANKKRLAL